MKRFKRSRGSSKRLFRNAAKYTHRKNVTNGPALAMRGGIRL